MPYELHNYWLLASSVVLLSAAFVLPLLMGVATRGGNQATKGWVWFPNQASNYCDPKLIWWAGTLQWIFRYIYKKYRYTLHIHIWMYTRPQFIKARKPFFLFVPSVSFVHITILIRYDEFQIKHFFIAKSEIRIKNNF